MKKIKINPNVFKKLKYKVSIDVTGIKSSECKICVENAVKSLLKQTNAK